MGRKKNIEPPKQLTVLDKVESAAIQAIDERDQLKEGLEQLKMERDSAIASYDEAIIETGVKLQRSTVLAEQLQALYGRDDVR